MKNVTFEAGVFRSPDVITDTHCHYNLEPLWPDWSEHWEKAQRHGVIWSIVPGTDVETSRRAVKIAEQTDGLWAMVGVHPHEGEQPFATDTMTQIEALLDSEKTFGIGEIGLDYYRLAEEQSDEREHQKLWLRAHLELAARHALPVSLHVRDRVTPEEPATGNAYWDVVQILEEVDWRLPFVLHCVSGPLSYVQRLLRRGAFISFAGNITYPNASALHEILAITPPERLLIETDAPFLAPQTQRGQACQPWMIAETARFVAETVSL